MWSVNHDCGGALYEVLPPAGSPILPDRGEPRSPGEAWMCRRASVVRVLDQHVTCETAIMLGLDTPGLWEDVTWGEIQRYARLLARAQAEGRQITMAEHADRMAADAADRLSTATTYRR